MDYIWNFDKKTWTDSNMANFLEMITAMHTEVTGRKFVNEADRYVLKFDDSEHKTLLTLYFSRMERDQKYFDALQQALGGLVNGMERNSAFYAVLKSCNVWNNKIIASRTLSKRIKLPAGIERQDVEKWASYHLLVIPEHNELKSLPNVNLTDALEKIHPLSGLEQIQWNKKYPANGYSCMTVEPHMLPLFSATTLKMTLPPPPVYKVRSLLSLFAQKHKRFNLDKYGMTDVSFLAIACRLQEYNKFCRSEVELNKPNLQKYMKLLREYGIISFHNALDLEGACEYNPDAICWGGSTQKVSDNFLDLRKGYSYRHVATGAHAEYLGWLRGNLNHEELLFIESSWNDRYVKGKVEILEVVDSKDLSDTLALDLPKGKYVKLCRTFATGSNCARTMQSVLLQPWQKLLKEKQTYLRNQGQKAPAISGVTFNKDGITHVFSYLIYGRSDNAINLEDLIKARFLALDRKRMEMTVRGIARVALWALIRSSIRAASLKKYSEKFAFMVTKESEPKKLTFAAGSRHVRMSAPAVLSGEPPTYILDEIDNTVECGLITEIMQTVGDKDCRFVNGGDDGLFKINETYYDAWLRHIEHFAQKRGCLWTDTELRRACIISEEKLEDFLSLRCVTTYDGSQEIDAWSIHQVNTFATIYGMIPVFVVGSSSSSEQAPQIITCFPVYKIDKILSSWWQPHTKPNAMSVLTQASIRACGLNQVIGMFPPINKLFDGWVKKVPIEPHNRKWPTEWADEGLVVEECYHIKSAEEVLKIWTQERGIARQQEVTSWADLVQDIGSWGDLVEEAAKEHQEELNAKGEDHTEASYEKVNDAIDVNLAINQLRERAVKAELSKEVLHILHTGEKLGELKKHFPNANLPPRTMRDVLKGVAHKSVAKVVAQMKLVDDIWFVEGPGFTVSLPKASWSHKYPPSVIIMKEEAFILGYPDLKPDVLFEKGIVKEGVNKPKAKLTFQPKPLHAPKRRGKSAKEKSRARTEERDMKYAENSTESDYSEMEEDDYADFYSKF